MIYPGFSLRTLAPFVREHSLLSTVHKILKNGGKTIAHFLDKDGVSCNKTMYQANITLEVILDSQRWKYW